MELTLDYSLMLDRGLVRERNDDRCAAFVPEDPSLQAERGCLFVLSDGMGGHAAGDVAAEITVQTVQETYFHNGWNGARAKLHDAFLAANEAILRAARHQGREGMGAAAVVGAVIGDRLAIAHMGDCRAYLIHGDRVTHLTSDHSWVQERMNSGRLTAEEARVHPYRNVLTRALGAEATALPDIRETTVGPGDTLVLCSDGLWGLAEDHDFVLTSTVTHDAAEMAQALMDLALSRGGHDNISVIVVRVSGAPADVPTVKMALDGQ